MEDELLTNFLKENGGFGDFLQPIETDKIAIGRLSDIIRRIPQEGTYLIISHYGTLSNAVSGEPSPSVDIVLEAARIIHKGLEKLRQDISVHGENVDKFTPEEVSHLRRTLAVMTYLAYRALTGIEGQTVKQNLNGNRQSTGGKKTKNSKVVRRNADDTPIINWMSWRSTIIEDLLSLLDYPVELIWDDSGYGFSVPRLLIRMLCTNFNEAYLAKDNLRSGTDAFKILGIVAKRFDKQVDVYERLFPIIKYGEDVAKIVTRAIDIMVSEFELFDSVPFALTSALELWDSCTEKNVALEKGIATLVSDLCETTPRDVVVKSAQLLSDFLNLDSAAIRSAVIGGTGHLLRWMKSENSKGQRSRVFRNLFIQDMLIKHSKDVNALIRGKALNTLTKLIDDKEIEPLEVAACLPTAIERLIDTAVLPRKYAAQMVTAILGKFPAICNPRLDFDDEVVTNRKRFLELMLRNSTKKGHYIYALLREFVDQAMQQTIPLPPGFKEIIDKGPDAFRKKLSDLLGDDKYWDACTLICHALSEYGSEIQLPNVGKELTIELYLKFFKLYQPASGDSQQASELETSFSLSETMSQPDGHWHEPEEIERERELLRFALGCEKMSKYVEPLVDQMIALLAGGTPNDKNEMISIFGDMVRCGFPVSDKISGPIIEAIAGAGKEAAENLLPAFWSIFIGPRDIGSVPLIRKLFQILSSVESTVKEMLQPVIQEMHAAKALTNDMVMKLWDAFTLQYDCWTTDDSRNAAFVIGALGKRDHVLILSNINVLIEKGLSDEAFKDMMRVKYVLEAILFSFKKTKKGESDVGYSIRLESNHLLFKQLRALLEYGVSKKGDWDTHMVFPRVAELAVQIMYKLSWEHQTILSEVLKSLPLKVFGNKNFPSDSELLHTEEIYIRYMSIMTAMLGAHINYYETVVLPELRRRKQLQHTSQQQKQQTVKGKKGRGAANAPDDKPTPSSTLSRSRSNRSARSGTNSVSNASLHSSVAGSSISNQTNAEMDVMIGNVGFDSEQETVKAYIEKLLDSGVFQQYRRITLYFCMKIKKVKHIKLQLVIVQALAKIMIVSPDSALKLADAFVNMWHTINNTRVKVEVIKQLTVLNVRFPNQMESCNAIIQSGLGSDIPEVKIACLDCMAFLALGDMVKIRDNIAEVALCLCDADINIREMAKDFFNVCADKDNVISNAVPEVISRLSKREDISQQEFQNIMKFLLVRVKKEKQVIGLVDTLVGRFKSTGQTERLSQDTAYCLSQLPHQEKTFKILRDHISNYADKLDDDIVFRSFVTIVETLRKTIIKPEFKLKLDDYQTELEESHKNCLEKRRIANAGNRHQKSKKKKGDNSKMEHSSLMEDDKVEEEDIEEEGNKQPKEEGNSDEEDENEANGSDAEEANGSDEEEGNEANGSDDEEADGSGGEEANGSDEKGADGSDEEEANESDEEAIVPPKIEKITPVRRSRRNK